MSALGHTVVIHGAATPLTGADFVGIDTAWHIGSSAAYISSGTTPSALVNYLDSGGALHLTGENGFFSTDNTAMLDLVNAYITDLTLVAGGGIVSDPVTIATGLSSSIADLLSVPNNIVASSIGTIGAGELLNVDSRNAFAVSGGGAVVGAVFGPGDVVIPGARISILMDVNWLTNSNKIDVIENLQVFLEGGPGIVAMPEPGTAALLFVTAGFLAVRCRQRRRV